jgi:thioesterase domain-containing protein/acyl carrier protein
MTDVQDNLSGLSTVAQKELLFSLLSQESSRVSPLSLAQQRLWFVDQLYRGNPVHNVPFGLRLRGNLVPSALELSIQLLVQRHEILRTIFKTEAGNPVQIVAADVVIDVPFLDLRNIPGSDRDREAYRIAIEESRLPFNLATGPLLRLKLIRLEADEYLLLCVIHHIITDGWSLEIFVRDLAVLYDQCSMGETKSLADLPIQYGDYAEWQHEWVAGGVLAEQAKYWRERLAGAPPLLQLPTDRPRPAEQDHEGASQLVPISADLVNDLATFSRTQHATLFMVLLAAFKVLLHCHTGVDDILVGVPVAGRNRVELEDLIGFFVNTLVLRTDFSGDSRFCDLVLEERQVALEAFAHADLPFEKLVEELNPRRTLSYTSLIQVMFSVVKVRKLPNFGEVSASPYLFDCFKSLFDLSAEVIEDAENRWWLRLEYATQLFDYGRIARMLDHYVTLLEAVAEQPELRVSELAALLDRDGRTPEHNDRPLRYREDKDHDVTRHRAAAIVPENGAVPRGALEQILVRIWERVLGISGIGIRQDFFDLGGHSLMAAHLVSEIAKAVGQNIPVSALFRSSTIESLANVIRAGTAWSAEPLVMELNAGVRGLPLFAIVQSGVDALGYAQMARHIGPDQPFYKLQAHTPACIIVPFSVEELRTIAREYIAAMRVLQPRGPYFLIGMCNGVHIGEQMVLELEAQGQEVGLFCIIDTFVWQNSYIRWLVRLESLRAAVYELSRLPLSVQLSQYKRAIENRLRRLLLREKAPINPWDEVRWPGKGFKPKQFRAPVLLFRRPRQPYYKVKDREMGWGDRSLSEVTVCMVDADAHYEMLREPSVQAISEKLKDVLLNIEKTYAASSRAS